MRIMTRFCLYCTVLYCTVLYCTHPSPPRDMRIMTRFCLFCTVLYCTVLYCTVLYSPVSAAGHEDHDEVLPVLHAGQVQRRRPVTVLGVRVRALPSQSQVRSGSS